MNINQPKGEATFEARYTSDGFSWEMQTKSGYSIIKSSDGYYYYALLDVEGEYTVSTSKVGINSPLPGSYNLDRSESRIAEIEAGKLDWKNSLNSIRVEHLLNGFLTEGEIALGILLVDFTDETTLYPEISTQKFSDLFFSENTWVGYSVHPENEELFGSLNDYYREQSCNSIELKGKNAVLQEILNAPSVPGSPNSAPDWLTVPGSKSNYTSTTLIPEAISQAISAGILNSNWQQTYDLIGVVFAGQS